MGLGQAMQEEMVWKDGLLMNLGMLEYKSPSGTESPEVECIIVESVDPEGPFGAKEASEGSLAATIPATGSATYSAGGRRLRAGLRKNELTIIQISPAAVVAAGGRLPGASWQRTGDPGRWHGPAAIDEAEAVYTWLCDGHPWD